MDRNYCNKVRLQVAAIFFVGLAITACQKKPEYENMSDQQASAQHENAKDQTPPPLTKLHYKRAFTYVDPEYGCEYISFEGESGVVPRMVNGVQVGCKGAPPQPIVDTTNK